MTAAPKPIAFGRRLPTEAPADVDLREWAKTHGFNPAVQAFLEHAELQIARRGFYRGLVKGRSIVEGLNVTIVKPVYVTPQLVKDMTRCAFIGALIGAAVGVIVGLIWLDVAWMHAR